MNAKIRKIRNQPLYEVKLYVRTLKEARQTVAMHGMQGSGTPSARATLPIHLIPVTPMQFYHKKLTDVGGTIDAAKRVYVQRLVNFDQNNGMDARELYRRALRILYHDFPERPQDMVRAVQAHYHVSIV